MDMGIGMEMEMAHGTWAWPLLPVDSPTLRPTPFQTRPASPVALWATLPRRASRVARRFAQALADGRLALEAPPFYTSSTPFYEMPEALRARLGAAQLVLTKGDANYRRMLGDLHWPHDTPFAELMEYWPTAVAALRTCKSGVLVGTAPERSAAAAEAHPDKWLTGGLYGVVQYRKA
mmetsp:Transcript_2757/g.6935  ORF Transcript_2757/g.6935 Transcript_2757/m.6935 type:complete len:177 (+) Transcript_2757:982-1512(+)